MTLTNHAKKRMKQRCGIGKKSSNKMAQKVLALGISHNQLTGQLCRWVDGLYLSKRTANNIKLYGNQAYIFHNDTLITVIPVPNSLIPLLNKTRQKLKQQR